VLTTRKRILSNEQELSAVWAAGTARRLKTESGIELSVLYPGMCPGGAGPDFRDAVLAFHGQEVVCGDVELHRRAGDWCRHGHGSDPAYSQVVLHAVAQSDGAASTTVPGGREAPVLVLAPSRRRMLPCAGASVRFPSQTLALLRAAGVERLRSKATRMVRECGEDSLRSVLCRSVARALGYAVNADPGMHLGVLLAEETPWSLLQHADAHLRRACVLGIAGLLPSQRSLIPEEGDDVETGALESLWQSISDGLSSMPAESWRLRGVYVNNVPVRRIVALADFIPRLEQVVDAARSALADAPCSRSAVRALESLFLVPGDSYWRGHYDFGAVTRESDLLGMSKAREIVVNALLPLLLCVAVLEHDEGLYRAVILTFAGYPGSRPNAVTKHMRRQIGVPGSWSRAIIEQGLIHVYGGYCRHGLCPVCPLQTGHKAPETHETM